jgi:hypothetical protein
LRRNDRNGLRFVAAGRTAVFVIQFEHQQCTRLERFLQDQADTSSRNIGPPRRPGRCGADEGRPAGDVPPNGVPNSCPALGGHFVEFMNEIFVVELLHEWHVRPG